MGSPTSNPNTNIQLLPAAVVDAYADRRDVIFGQVPSTAGGASSGGMLTTDVHLLTTAEIKTLCGATSYLTNCILDWKSTNEGYSPLDVVSITEVTNANAAGIMAVTGTASADGTLYISVVDEEKYEVAVSVSDLDTHTAVATAIHTALDALTDTVFVSTNSPAGSCTVTATDEGTIGDTYGIKIRGTVPGISIAITAFTGGGTDPTLTGILDLIAGIRYTGIIWPEAWRADTTAQAALKTEMETRFNASNTIMDGTVFQGFSSKTFLNVIVTLLSENSQTFVNIFNPVLALADHKGPAVIRPADWIASEFLGIRSRRLTTGAPIADDIISTSGGLDAFGGPSLASLPYFNTPLRLTPVTPATNLLTGEEQSGLEIAGGTGFGVNSAKNMMLMGPVVTNWTTDAGENENVSFHYLNYVDTGSVCREMFHSVLKSTYAQSRLTEGELIPGRSIANAESIKATLMKIYKILSDLALTQAGSEAQQYFSDNTTVTVSLATRTVTISGPLPIVTQMGTINYSLQLAFTVGSTGTQITV